MKSLAFSSVYRSTKDLIQATWKLQLRLFGIILGATVVITLASTFLQQALHLSDSLELFSRYRIILYLVGYVCYLAAVAIVQQLYCCALLAPARGVSFAVRAIPQLFARFFGWTIGFAIISQLAFAPYLIGVYGSFSGALGPTATILLFALGVFLILLLCAYCALVLPLMANGSSLIAALRGSVSRTHGQIGMLILILIVASVLVGVCTMLLNGLAGLLGAWGMLLELVTLYAAVTVMFSVIITVYNELR